MAAAQSRPLRRSQAAANWHLDLVAAVNQALADQNGVEGGIWQTDAGPLAYAFPTYAGTGPKTDLPAAERDHIKAVNEQAVRDERPITRRSVSQEQNLLLRACPLSGPIPGLTAWTMARVEAVPDYDRLVVGLSALLGLMVLMSAWLGRVLMLWARYVSDIEAAPGSGGAVGAPTISHIGEREPARVVEAHRAARQRHGKARQQSAILAARASRVELLAFTILSIIIALALSAAVATLWSPRSVIGGDTVKVAAGAIFAGAYLALAIGKIPGLRIDRAGVALVGASLMVGAGVLTLDEASQAVDFGTIALLLGIMIVVANLRLSGFFALANAIVARHVRRPIVLLATVVIVSGFFSAFLDNDAICLVLSPLVLELSLSLKRKPTPYLLAVAVASNIGSTATMTGNPQNIMIGSFSGVPYFQFTLALAPLALAGLVLTVLLLALAYRAEFLVAERIAGFSPIVRVQRVLLARALLATGIMVALFFAGQPPAKVAIVIGGLLLLTGRIKSERIYREIDWSLLLMFVGLFIIVAGAQHDTAWLVVAMASTLAGNFTVLGSIANLIVVQKAATKGVSISFWEYFRVGAPLTLITLALGTLFSL